MGCGEQVTGITLFSEKNLESTSFPEGNYVKTIFRH